MRTLQGTIVSNRMTKTVTVRVDRLKRHPKYRKYYRVSRKYKAHADDASMYRPGDVVTIEEVRPLSREKRWRVTGVIRQAARASEDEADASEAQP
mgnify:CR=1 FL=1